jgi:hypothetical protein
VVDVYTKGGDIGTYHAFLALVPDYDIAISVMMGGPEASGGHAQALLAQVVKSLIPSLEQAGIKEASKAFAGVYINEETNSTLILDVDDEGLRLNITEWFVRGTDVSANWDNYLSVLGPSPPISLAGHLYPTGLKAEDKTSWSAVYRFGTAEEVAEQEKAYFWEDSSCTTWTAMDRGACEFLGLDEMQYRSEQCKAVEVELMAFRTILKRVERVDVWRGAWGRT